MHASRAVGRGRGRDGIPATVTSEAAFLVDFLPVSRRTLTRTGFVIGHVHYCDALKPWIACRGRLGRFVIRRDPRDISRIWVLDPDGGTYLQVPYRTLSHPPISAWEQRAAVANAARARGQRLGRPPAMTAGQIRQVRELLTLPATASPESPACSASAAPPPTSTCRNLRTGTTRPPARSRRLVPNSRPETDHHGGGGPLSCPSPGPVMTQPPGPVRGAGRSARRTASPVAARTRRRPRRPRRSVRRGALPRVGTPISPASSRRIRSRIASAAVYIAAL